MRRSLSQVSSSRAWPHDGGNRRRVDGHTVPRERDIWESDREGLLVACVSVGDLTANAERVRLGDAPVMTP